MLFAWVSKSIPRHRGGIRFITLNNPWWRGPCTLRMAPGLEIPCSLAVQPRILSVLHSPCFNFIFLNSKLWAACFFFCNLSHPQHSLPYSLLTYWKTAGVGYSLVFLRQDKALPLKGSALHILSDWFCLFGDFSIPSSNSLHSLHLERIY